MSKILKIGDLCLSKFFSDNFETKKDRTDEVFRIYGSPTSI